MTTSRLEQINREHTENYIRLVQAKKEVRRIERELEALHKEKSELLGLTITR